ncbi:hypothetical protein NEMIN01_1424 [Nematocida minor]|uniref:uncharacterized protein n=1 Tax=Nematocida minor TaxID=1912983 RepID=UPI00221F19F9|nr:uncharacterized protein NEMIN01_1424 [Nematocida minor]KAI5191216.1 hypothetical protein NEMIN01_1424 [Nematocida minor]
MPEYDTRTVPAPIKLSIFAVVIASSYPAALSCIISDPWEVLVTLLAGSLSFLAIIGKSTKTKLTVSSAASFLLFFLPSGYFRAFCVGFLLAYSQTVAEIHTSRLSLSPFRDLAISLLGILMTMQACVFFFFLSFIPGFAPIFQSFFFVLALVCLQVALVVLCAPTPPVELINPQDASALYGPVYNKLSRIFKDTPFSCFYDEYSELVSRYSTDKRKTANRVSSIIEKVNISFISTGIVGLLSTISNTSMYLTIFTSVTMFKWIYANKYPKDYIILTVISTLVVLVSIFIYDIQPIFIILMGCSLYLVPSYNTYLCLDSYVIGVSNTIRNTLGTIVYIILEREQYITKLY